MKFEKDYFLNYCLIDMSDDDGQVVDENNGFYVYNPEAIDAQCPHNIVFVHGYKTDFFYAMKTASHYYDNLIGLIRGKANFIGIYWPGNTGINFSKAVRQASTSAPNFAAALNYIIRHSTTENPFISLIAHSLGNRECAQTILTLKSQYNLNPVKKFIQLAPAINANAYQNEFQGVPLLVPHVTVYYSVHDTVLKDAYGTWNALINWDWNAAWGSLFQQKRPDDAMGFLGPFGDVPKSVQTINANDIAGIPVDHGTYLENKKLIADLAKLINN